MIIPTQRFFALTVTLCVLLTTASADEPGRVRPFSAKYTIENNYITAGVAYLSLQSDSDNNFDLLLQTKPKGVFKWTSKGHLLEHAKLPAIDQPYNSISYLYQDKGNKTRNYSAMFSRNSNEAQVEKAGQTTTINIDETVTDRLSMMLVVMNELQNNNTFSSIDVRVLDESKIRTMTFTNRGRDTVETELGNLPAIRIHRGGANSNRETVSWFSAMAEQSTLVPVKIEQFKNGKLTLRLELIEFSALE